MGHGLLKEAPADPHTMHGLSDADCDTVLNNCPRTDDPTCRKVAEPIAYYPVHAVDVCVDTACGTVPSGQAHTNALMHTLLVDARIGSCVMMTRMTANQR